jgi:cytosine/adenosine deaminase-related metal-dependent hydrolase
MDRSMPGELLIKGGHVVSGFGIDTNAPALARGEQVPAVDLHQRDMLRPATIDGARVWHLEDETGTLTPGKQADIAIIDMRSQARKLMHATRHHLGT